jgi:oxaloacetate decarboxylase (Na+ extruding) subunit alpha
MTCQRVRLTDVSLTDGQSAVWAGAMTTPMVGAVMHRLAAARPAAIEVCSPTIMRQCVARSEDPWQRVDLIRERCPDMALRAVVALVTDHGKRGADLISLDVAVQWLHELAQRGIGEVLFIDPMLDMRRLAPLLHMAATLGVTPIAALPFYQDADLTDGALCKQAAALAAAGAARVMLRDESGVMTPDRLAALLPALRQALAATPLDLHLGCQTALGPLVALEAIRLGVDGLDTAFAPLANGASVPSLGTLVKSARLLGLDQSVDGVCMPAVDAANRQLVSLADRHDFPVATPWAFSLSPYVHQLPGDVAADFMVRLAARDLWPKLSAFANECSRIRCELGRPPMLAPFARAIAEQAWRHLQGLPRYAELHPGVRRTIQQIYGSTPGSIEPRLARRVGRLAKLRPTSLKALRVQFPGMKDPALVLAQICGVSPTSLPGPAPRESLDYVAATPIDALIEGLSARAARFARLDVAAPDFAVRLCGGKGICHV